MLDQLLNASPSHRREFLGQMGAAVGLGLVARLPAPLAAASASNPDPVDRADKWLDTLKGKHRQLFDMPLPEDGLGLLHIRNFLATYREAYGVPEKELNAVGTLYGKTIPLGFTDEMWVKYKFGAALNITDVKTNAPLERNMFAHPQAGDPLAFGFLDSSVEALQAKGALFILCNNALNFWVGRLSAGGMGAAADIRADLLAHLLPKIVIVPAMVVAINKAQERGISYMKL
jgi:intracellular sulfur oxidation DsrE/DsrF family protein